MPKTSMLSDEFSFPLRGGWGAHFTLAKWAVALNPKLVSLRGCGGSLGFSPRWTRAWQKGVNLVSNSDQPDAAKICYFGRAFHCRRSEEGRRRGAIGGRLFV